MQIEAATVILFCSAPVSDFDVITINLGVFQSHSCKFALGSLYTTVEYVFYIFDRSVLKNPLTSLTQRNCVAWF